MKPMWLEVLLSEKFFTACGTHDCCKKNEKNIFCLDCVTSICQHCLHDHNSHQLLQIRRYVYHDVIRLHDIQKLLDCSRVQAYTINSARVVFLKERPQPKSNKGLSGNCESCERSLQDAYKFCSVACKVDMSFPSSQPESKMECVEYDISTTTQQSLSCKGKQAFDNTDDNAVIDQVLHQLDLIPSGTTSFESSKYEDVSSLSNHDDSNVRSISFVTCKTTPILTKPHHMACTTLRVRAPRRPQHNHQYHNEHDNHSSYSTSPTSLHSSKLIPSPLSKRRKPNKPNRSPFS